MHLRNLDGTEDFHVPQSTGKALLETGKFVEIKAATSAEIPKQPSQWQIIHRTEGSPVLRGFCPNCKAEMFVSGQRAAYNKLFHVCFGGPEDCPYEIAREYVEALEAWKKSEEERAKKPKRKLPGFTIQVGG